MTLVSDDTNDKGQRWYCYKDDLIWLGSENKWLDELQQPTECENCHSKRDPHDNLFCPQCCCFYDFPIQLDPDEAKHIVQHTDFSLRQHQKAIFGYWSTIASNLLISPKRLIFLQYANKAKLSYSRVLFEMPLEHIWKIALNQQEIRINARGEYKGLYTDVFVSNVPEYFSDAILLQAARPSDAKRAAMAIMKNRDIRNRELAEVTVRHTGEVVQYQIATSFVFGANGALLIQCPYCHAQKPQNEKASKVTCQNCGQTYMIPEKLLKLL
jgi:hypothetical protein